MTTMRTLAPRVPRRDDRSGRSHTDAYRASTSILLPMVGYKYVPQALRRTIFLDFERFEYGLAAARPRTPGLRRRGH